jgi:hypothetical protein
VGAQASRSDLSDVISSGGEYEKGWKTNLSSLYYYAGENVSAKITSWRIAHLAMLDLVPPFNEVLDNVKDDGAIDRHVYLVLHVK